MDCPACGGPNEDDALFCGSCGTTLNTAKGEAVQETLAEVTAGIEEGQEESVHEAGHLPEAAPPRAQERGTAYTAAAKILPTSGMAITALIFGIGGLTFLPLLGSLIAVILGPMARSDIRRRSDEVTGDGVALVGLVLGWIGIGLTILGALIFGAITVCALIGAFGATWPAN